MKTKLALFIILAAFLLAGCSQTYVCPDGSTAGSAEACIEKTNLDTLLSDEDTNSLPDATATEDITPQPSDYTFTLDEKELASIITVKDYSYVAAPEEDPYGDKSSVRNIQGTKKYEAHMQTDINYEQAGKYRDATIFMKVIGAGISGDLSSVVYQGYLWPDEQTINFTTILQTHAESPRMKFCFGFTPDFDPFFEESEHVACFTKLFEGPIHKLFLSRTDIELSFNGYEAEVGEILQMSKDMLIENNGNVPTTFFIYIPNEETQYNMTPTKTSVFLHPGEKETIQFTGLWNYTGETIFARELGGVYTVGHACHNTFECFDGARFSEELTIEYHN